MKCILCDTNEAKIHGMCESCFVDHIQVTTNGTIDVTICPKCNAFKIGNSWSRRKIEAPLSKKINEHLVVNDPNVSAKVLNDSVALRRLEKRIVFRAALNMDGDEVAGKEMDIPARILLNSCPTCNKITGSYYEAIIQLRTLTAEFSPIINKVMEDISPFLEKLDQSSNDSFVSRIQPVKEGVDIYLGKKNDGIKLSKYIHDHFFSTTTTTKKLAGRRESEDFYRHTYLVRLFNLEPGTVIHGKDKAFILERVNANSLTVIDPRNEKRYDILQNDFNAGQYTYSMEPMETRKFLVVSNENRESTVMDQENFQVLTIKGDFEGEITAVNYNGRYIVIRA